MNTFLPGMSVSTSPANSTPVGPPPTTSTAFACPSASDWAWNQDSRSALVVAWLGLLATAGLLDPGACGGFPQEDREGQSTTWRLPRAACARVARQRASSRATAGVVRGMRGKKRDRKGCGSFRTMRRLGARQYQVVVRQAGAVS